MIKLLLIDIDGVITNGKLIIDESGKECKQIDFKDIDAIFRWKKLYKIGFITGEDSPIVDYFEKKFKPDYFIKGCKDKLNAIIDIEKKESINFKEIAYIGDSNHDIEAIKYVGLGICPKDSVSKLKEIADLVLDSNGGNGCIDELEKILMNHSNNLNNDKNNNNNTDNNINNNNTNNNNIKNNIKNNFNEILEEHINITNKLKNDKKLNKNIIAVSEVIVNIFNNSGNLFLCGNGGSASDAQHIATEFVSRFYKERRALPAEALTVNTSSITAIANDYTFDHIFSRQLEAKAKEKDIIIGITTSGKSKNVIEALKQGKKMRLKTVTFTGETCSNELEKLSDYVISVPSSDTPRIQEIHILIGHFICEYVENRLFE